MKKIKINFPLPNDINLTHYNIFKKNNIDIYNPNDDAFNTNCYTNSKLKNDYPIKYRQNKIYSQKIFEGMNEICLYEEIDIENKMVVMQCKYSENGFVYKYKDNQLKEIKINYIFLKSFYLLRKSFNKLNKVVQIFGLLLCSIFFSLILSKCSYWKEKEYKVINNNDIESQKDSFEKIKEGTCENEDVEQV